ncbi:MAG: RNA polymerase factor sigma-54, partial [Verrucomicrobiota bacterium]
MSQGLHLSQRMALSQVLAPQLQQSLALLQAPTLELRALVEQELEVNPVLEEVLEVDARDEKPSKDGEEPAESPDPTEPPADVTYDSATDKPDGEPVDDFQAEFDKLTQLDQEWRDHFAQTNVPMRHSAEEEEKREFMFNSIVSETSLQEHLLDQLRMSEVPREQHPIAEMIIGNIDDYGYLQSSVEELSFSTSIPVEQITAVLKVIQTFQPPGVGARNLRECLMLQLERAGREDAPEYTIVRDHMEALGKRRIPEIARALGMEVDEAQEVVEKIGHLEPRPGRAFLPDNHQYIVPEVFVQRVGDDFVVTLNNDQIPHLRISNVYKDLMSKADASSEVRDYIRDKIRAGKFLIKSLHQRQQTILNIGNEIVKRQREFMEKGVAFLKPLTMVQVAEAVGVHETTVSRAVSAKYMETPQGVFEMKYFFTSGIKTADGTGMSNTSVKDMIADMIKNEPPQSPYSDDQIVKMLKEKNIVIARRTVAKYRSELN